MHFSSAKMRIGIGLTAAAILGVGIWFYFSLDRRGRAMLVYEGKTAEQWFFGSNSQAQARLAFHGMGTNCVPFLLEKAVMRDSALKRFYHWLWLKLPRGIRPNAPRAPGYIQTIAWTHLANWSRESDFMLPQIFASIKRVESDWVRYRAFDSMTFLLGRMPRPDREAHYAAFLDDPSFMIKFEAAVQLARLVRYDTPMTNALPILLNAATNTTFLERDTLESYSPNVQIPTNVVKSIIQSRQQRAGNALKLYGVEPHIRIQTSRKPSLDIQFGQ